MHAFLALYILIVNRAQQGSASAKKARQAPPQSARPSKGSFQALRKGGSHKGGSHFQVRLSCAQQSTRPTQLRPATFEEHWGRVQLRALPPKTGIMASNMYILATKRAISLSTRQSPHWLLPAPYGRAPDGATVAKRSSTLNKMGQQPDAQNLEVHMRVT